MNHKEKIYIELLKTSQIFPGINIPIKSYNIQKISNSVNRKHRKIDSLKKHKRIFSSDLIKMKKINSSDDDINSAKNNYQNNHNSSQLTKNFHGKSLFYKNSYNKSLNKPIKINIVSQKFKIANDFNEKNSNEFLNEKDECLREQIISDEIEEEESINFYTKKEKGKINELSSIKQNEYKDYLNNKQFKKKIVKAEFIEDQK